MIQRPRPASRLPLLPTATTILCASAFALAFAFAYAFPLASAHARSDKFPEDLENTRFSGPDVTPCPACLCAAPTGEVYVGVDLLGSLGKGSGRGKIVRLVDTDNDGVADQHTDFAIVDNPRGLTAIGNKLWVLHTVIPDGQKLTGMHVSVFEDRNGDGVADGEPKRILSNISTVKHNQNRGADHTTNGIRFGIDGWIYIAVGDFGFVDAVGSDGTNLTMLGGGVVRIRPDGTEFEVYTRGLRNIYDVAIDPRLNLFTRGNTNDGGGWNVRFIHHIQTANYGYPVLFKNFADEILPALVDLGGGSGTGSYYLQEPGWPEEYNDRPIMCDWGRSAFVIHRVTPNGASFTQEPEEFIKLSQITDADADGSGRLYLGAWDGAGYKGNPGKGYVERVVPKGWTYTPFPNLKALKPTELVAKLRTPSATTRFHAQQEILTRPAAGIANAVAALAVDKAAALDARIAAIFTYKQLLGARANANLAKLAGADDAVREWALRAIADRKTQLEGAPLEAFVKALGDKNPRVQVAAAVALGRLGDKRAAEALLAHANPPAGETSHDKPNADIILPHIAVRALVDLDATEACLAAVGGPNTAGALWALRSLHTPSVVEGLLARHQSASADAGDLGDGILRTLIRLYQKEAPYDGSWWWGTRPDTRGPYYKPATWEASEQIAAFVAGEYTRGSPETKATIETAAARNRAEIKGIKVTVAAAKSGRRKKPKENKVNLAKIANKQGQIGKMSIEDVMLALDKVKGKPKHGAKLFATQGCIACHTTSKDQPPKGPYMGQVGAVLSPEQIAESILKPNASISQGFATVLVETKTNKTHTGFITAETSDEIELRDIAGNVTRVATRNIKSRQDLDISMMPPGLANALSLEDFASLVAYLAGMKG